jgi:hypothetical protein
MFLCTALYGILPPNLSATIARTQHLCLPRYTCILATSLFHERTPKLISVDTKRNIGHALCSHFILHKRCISHSSRQRTHWCATHDPQAFNTGERISTPAQTSNRLVCYIVVDDETKESACNTAINLMIK